VIGQGGEEGMQWVRVIDGALQEWEAKNRKDGRPSKKTGCVTPSFEERDNQYKQVGGTSSDTGSSSSVTESCFRDDESAQRTVLGEEARIPYNGNVSSWGNSSCIPVEDLTTVRSCFLPPTFVL